MARVNAVKCLASTNRNIPNYSISGIERQMGVEAFQVVFKSITADNGSEFLDYARYHVGVGRISTMPIRIHLGSAGATKMPTGSYDASPPRAKFTKKKIQGIED